MSEHRASVHWVRETEDFSYESYGRDHVWRFEIRKNGDGGPQQRG